MKVLWHEQCSQGSTEWWTARCGVPTASAFDRIITPALGKPSAQADDYAAELASDVAAPAPNWLTEQRSKPPNPAMRNGQEMEPEARRFYSVARDCRVRLVGFCTTDDGRFGCSPDGLVVDDRRQILGGLELKCPLPRTHASYLLKGVLPLEYRCQVHGSLLVTGLPWWDFMSYCPGLEPLLIRVEPDEFTVKLAEALDAWFPRYLEIRKQILGPQDDPANTTTEATNGPLHPEPVPLVQGPA